MSNVEFGMSNVEVKKGKSAIRNPKSEMGR